MAKEEEPKNVRQSRKYLHPLKSKYVVFFELSLFFLLLKTKQNKSQPPL